MKKEWNVRIGAFVDAYGSYSGRVYAETAEEAIEAAKDAIHLFEFSLEGFTHEPDFDDIALECEGVLR